MQTLAAPAGGTRPSVVLKSAPAGGAPPLRDAIKARQGPDRRSAAQKQADALRELQAGRAEDDHTSWEEVGDAKRNELLKAKAQELGMPEAELRKKLEMQRLLDWSKPSSEASHAVQNNWLYGIGRVLGVVDMAEPTRWLPDNTLVPNPQVLGDRETFDAAIDAAHAPPHVKEATRARWNEYHQAWLASIRPTLETMETLPGVENYMAWRERMQSHPETGPEFNHKTEEQKADQYLEEQKRRNPLVKLADNLSANLMAGAHDIVTGLAGTVAALSGSQMMAEYAAEKAAEAQRTVGALELTGNDGFANAVVGGVARALPGLAAAYVTGGAGAVILGGGTVFADVYSERRSQGLTHEAAAEAATTAAAAGAVLSAVLSKVMPGAGRAGAGGLTGQAVRRELGTALQAVMDKAAKTGVSMARGALEEMSDELVDGAVSHFTAELAKGRTWEEAAASYLQGLPTNLATSGALGGGGGARAPSSPPGRQPQPNSQSDGLPRLQFSRGQTNHARQQTQQNLAESATQSIIDHDNTPIQSSSRLHLDRSGGNAQASRESTRALLGGAAGTIPGWAGAAGQRRRAEAERAYLERHATPSTDKGTLFAEGGEHHVYYRAGDDFITKATHSGKYGQVLDQMGPEEGYRFNLRPASPSEYLTRIALTNKVFGDNIEVIGYEQTPDGPSIITKQPPLEGPHPDEKQTEAFLRAHGFEPMDERLYDDKTLNFVKRPWYRAKDGVVVVDAKPQNFVLHKGKVMPVDLMIQLLPDDVLNLTKSARQRQYSVADGERKDGSNGPTLGSYFGNDSGKLGREVAATSQLWQQKQPGLLNESTHVFHSAEELMNSDYAKQHPFTDEEKAAMRNAEGFYDASTGRTVIIAGNVGLRPGETPQSALTRVMLHERVGHDGLGLLLNAPGDRPGKPNINRERWDNLQKHIPSHLTEAIGNQPGYEHLKGNPEALALEWFAREAEKHPKLLTQPSLVMRMWDNFKQGLVDLMARLGLDPLKGQELDAQVMALLQRARQAAVRPSGTR